MHSNASETVFVDRFYATLGFTLWHLIFRSFLADFKEQKPRNSPLLLLAQLNELVFVFNRGRLLLSKIYQTQPKSVRQKCEVIFARTLRLDLVNPKLQTHSNRETISWVCFVPVPDKKQAHCRD